MRRVIPVLLILMPMIGGSVGVAHAGVFVTTTAFEVHAGLGCVPKPGDDAKLAYNLTEGVRNTSAAAAATVFCPVDTVPVKQGAEEYIAAPQAVRVFVIDRSSTANISCTLKSVLENNGFASGNTYPVKSSTGSAGAPQILQWTSADGPINIANYTFRVSCTLPAAPNASHQSAVVQTEVEMRTNLFVGP